MERRKSNVEALEALYNQYVDLVLKVCYHYCEDREIANNMTQEVFLTLITEIDNIDMDRVKKWLMVTAKHKTLNFVKRRNYEVLTDDFTEIMDAKDSCESAEEAVLEIIESTERNQREQEMLKALYEKNERWYMAITLTYYLDYSQVKVAEMMDMETNAFYALMNRAKRWIEEYYKKLD